MSLQRVKTIAKEIRKLMEETNICSNSDLGGECGRASAQLYLACKRGKIRGVKFASNNQHAFNIYKDHIIDITATQFGYKRKVYIKKITGNERCWHRAKHIRKEPRHFDFVSVQHMNKDEVEVIRRIGF